MSHSAGAVLQSLSCTCRLPPAQTLTASRRRGCRRRNLYFLTGTQLSVNRNTVQTRNVIGIEITRGRDPGNRIAFASPHSIDARRSSFSISLGRRSRSDPLGEFDATVWNDQFRSRLQINATVHRLKLSDIDAGPV